MTVADIGDYEATRASLSWETPERFNYGHDVADRLAAQDRPAMIWQKADGEERRPNFADFSALSNTFTGALARDIQDYCKTHTAPHKYPRRIESINYLPKTTSGKIRRIELRGRERV